MVAVPRAAPSGLTVSLSDNDRIPASACPYVKPCRNPILVDFLAASYSWPRFPTVIQEQTMATFGYGRVSTVMQTTDNQRLELEQAGYQIEADFWFADEGISGKVAASQRPAFKAMLGQIRKGETLVVSKLDRLGRDAIDVLQTVRQIGERGIKVVVMQLGSTDLTAPAGKLLLSMLAAVAEMERDLLVERTQAGLSRARAEGKKLGRPSKTTPEERSEIRRRLAAGETVSALARAYSVSRATVLATDKVSSRQEALQ